MTKSRLVAGVAACACLEAMIRVGPVLLLWILSGDFSWRLLWLVVVFFGGPIVRGKTKTLTCWPKDWQRSFMSQLPHF